MATRIFAVLAAVFLVGAVGIAALTPSQWSLGIGLVQMNPAATDWIHDHSPSWAWTYTVLPFLQRPLWLLPACVGLVCSGLAASFNLGKSTNTRRRRS